MSLLNLPAWPGLEGFLWLGLTVGLYVVFLRLRLYFNGSGLAQPLLWVSAILAGILVIGDMPVARFEQGGLWLVVVLGLSTVSIGVPIYDNFPVIRQAAGAFFLAMLIGSVTAVGTALVVAHMMQLDAAIFASLATKSITSPLAFGVASEIGGLPTLAMGIVIITGNFGVLVGPRLFALIGVHDVRAQGLAYGVAAHGIGTAEAMRLSSMMGSFAGLSMGINGVLTSILLPYLFVLA
jgi:putative effector of murein hydrolase